MLVTDLRELPATVGAGDAANVIAAISKATPETASHWAAASANFTCNRASRTPIVSSKALLCSR